MANSTPNPGSPLLANCNRWSTVFSMNAPPAPAPTAKHEHGTNALGLIALVHQATDGINHVSPHQRAEISVVIDYRTLIEGVHQDTVMHTGTDVDIPISTIRRMA